MNLSFVTLLAGRGALMVSSIIAVRIYTQVLGPREVGAMNLVLSAINLFALLSGSIGQYFNRQVMEWQSTGRLTQNLRNYCVFVCGFAFVASSLMFAPYRLGEDSWRHVPFPWLFALTGLTLVVMSINNALLYVLNVTGSRGTYVFLSNLAAWVGLGASIFASSRLGPNAEYWLAGAMTGHVISILVATTIVCKASSNPAPSASRAVSDFRFSPVARFSWPLVICMGLYWVQRSSYGPMMAEIGGLQMFGLFSVAFSIGVLAMTSFDTLMKDYYNPIYYRAIAGQEVGAQVAAWNTYMSVFAPSVAVALAFVAACAPAMTRLLVSEEFRALSWVVGWGALSQALVSIYSIYVVLASTFMDNRTLIVPNVAGSGVAVILLVTLLPRAPMLAAGVAICMAVVVTTFLTARRLKRLDAKIQFPMRKLFAAVTYSCPLLLICLVERYLWVEDSIGRAISLLGAGSVYVLFVQYKLATRR